MGLRYVRLVLKNTNSVLTSIWNLNIILYHLHVESKKKE